MKIAIIGAGISGLVAARLLAGKHDVALFEAADYVGGHTHTVDVASDDGPLAIDTGFIVYNERTYPAFCGLLDELNVETQPTSMSFGVRCDRCGLEYSGSSLRGLAARWRNLASPAFHRMLVDILRFNSARWTAPGTYREELTVGEFLLEGGYSKGFAEHYLLPMGGAIWSCPMETFGAFPMRFILEFYRNHGLMQITDRPVWRVIRGGSRSYVDRLIDPFRDRIRLRSPVSSVRRKVEGIEVSVGGSCEQFDELVFACHSDQALRMLESPDHLERSLLGAFPYGDNTALLHTDVSVLPRRRAAWSSWNYRVPASSEARPRVTYLMNMLQGLPGETMYCVSLNEEDEIDPAKVLGTYRYSHPVFTLERAAAQSRHRELIRRDRISYCGAYWGNGFHEDGVQSALAVTREFGIVPRWGEAGPERVAADDGRLTGPRRPEVNHAG